MKPENKGRTAWGLCLLLACAPLCLRAQDAKPRQVQGEEERKGTLREVREPSDTLRPDTVALRTDDLRLPASFLHTQENRILHPEGLNAFFQKVDHRGDRTVRVVHIGDSHVRGHVFPLAVRQRLEEAWGSEAVFPDPVTYKTTALARETGQPGLVCHAMGKNGVTLDYYMDDLLQRQIADLRPDLIIVSLGTNESHGVFEPASYTMLLDRLVNRMRELCPGVTFLFTTPPGSHLTNYRTVRRKRKGRYRMVRVAAGRTPNLRAGTVAAALRQYGTGHGYAVWDLYEIGGGDRRACANWNGAGLMARDGVHYTPEAYRIQGNLLAEAILEAYNDYLKR